MATGLVQWTPYTKYTNWVSGDPSTMDNNLSRIIYELENNLQWISTSAYNLSFEEFSKSNESPYYLGMAFVTNYERPAEISTIRGTHAEFWYEYLGGTTPTPPTPFKSSNNWLKIMSKKIRIRT